MAAHPCCFSVNFKQAVCKPQNKPVTDRILRSTYKEKYNTLTKTLKSKDTKSNQHKTDFIKNSKTKPSQNDDEEL